MNYIIILLAITFLMILFEKRRYEKKVRHFKAKERELLADYYLKIAKEET